MTPDEAVLSFNVWGMDDTQYRVLKNAMVTTRRPQECAICFGAIPVGSRVRTQIEVYDGTCKTFRFCVECCEAMVADFSDHDSERVESRYDIGRKRAEAREGVGPPPPL